MLKLLVGALMVVVLAGCSDPEPKEPKPSASATPTIAVPTMPPQAKENTPEGAAAFVHHYIDVSNYAASTGDVNELSRLSDSTCSGCQKYIELYRDTYAAGGYFKGGDWAPGEMHLEFGEPETYATTTVTSSPGRFRSSNDAPEETSEADSTPLTYGVFRSGDEWRTSQLVLGGAE